MFCKGAPGSVLWDMPEPLTMRDDTLGRVRKSKTDPS